MIPSQPAGLEYQMTMMGKAGKRLDEIGACEGAAGNISVCLRGELETVTIFPIASEIELPLAVPELGGTTILVSGSGCRLRDIQENPQANLACLKVNDDGKNGTLSNARQWNFKHVTSEFNSHLAVHREQMKSAGTAIHAMIHAQPVHLTYLSHIRRYQDEAYLNTHLMRWQPETIINLPEGIGFIPFHNPNSLELMTANVECLRNHQVVIWAKHGVMARSDISVMHAVDLIEYAETAARYECMNLATGEIGEGMSAEEMREMCERVGIRQDIF
jgi:rhamnulose-1-phosphate aldolase